MPTRIRRFAAIVLGGFVLASAPAVASAQQMWNDGGSRALDERSMVPALSSAEAYIERYNFNADLDGGGHVGVRFVISNMGWGDGSAAAKVKLELPNRDDYKFKKKRSRGEWSYSKNKLKLSVADTKLTRPEEGKFVIEHEGDTSLRIVFENRLSAWQPGNGELKAGSSYYRTQILAPRAEVTGTAKIGGEKVEFSSESGGYGEHTATNVAPYKMATRFSWFRTFNDNVTVIWKYVDLTDKFGGGEIAWIMVGYNRRIVFSHGDATAEFGRLQPDGTSGYRVPKAVQIEAEDGEDNVKFVLKGDSYKRKNLMKSWGSVVQTIASSVTNPYRFKVPGDYSFQMTIQGATAKVSGNDKFRMDILND